MVTVVGVVGSLGVAVLAGSAAYATYLLSRRVNGRGQALEREVARERLRAYREIMAAVVALNRQAVDLGSMQFREEADLMAYDQESKLSDAYGDVAESYESNFHVISPGVREAASDYVDYLATYHDEGAQVGELLSLSGSLAEAMRRDLGLESLFPQPSEQPVPGASDADAGAAQTDSTG